MFYRLATILALITLFSIFLMMGAVSIRIKQLDDCDPTAHITEQGEILYRCQ